MVDREMRKEMGKETLGDDSEGLGKFKDVPWNAGRALYIKQGGIALQGNSRHTAPGGRYVILISRDAFEIFRLRRTVTLKLYELGLQSGLIWSNPAPLLRHAFLEIVD